MVSKWETLSYDGKCDGLPGHQPCPDLTVFMRGGGVWGGRGGRDERKGRGVRYWILTMTRFIKEYEWTWADWNGNQMKYWDLASTGEASPLNKRNAIRLLLLKPEKAGWSRPVLSVDINVPIYILNYRSWKKFCFYTLCVCSRKYAPFFPPLTLSCHWPLCCSLFFDWLLSSFCYYHHVIQSKGA